MAELGERVVALEVLTKAMADKMDVGDRNVRQGIEVVKEGQVALQQRIDQMADHILGVEGKRALRSDLTDIRNDINSIRKDLHDVRQAMHDHQTNHALDEGGRRTWDVFKQRYAAPIIVGLIIVIPNLIMAFILARS